MAYGLNCLVNDISAIRSIGTAMRSISDTILYSDSKANITVKDLHKKLKSADIDIDLESAAYIYADTFANDINQYSNFETDEDLKKYSSTYPPISKGVKKALIEAGYSRQDKEGNPILDWTTLMRKSEDEIRSEIQAKNISNENDIFNSLQNEWKQIVSTALIKAKNDLSKKNEQGVTPRQRDAIEKIADLHTKGLFSDFRDDYSNAINKALGADSNQLDAMNEIDDIAKTAKMLQISGIGTNNYLGQTLQTKINKIVSQARYKDANWFYKTVKAISNVMELANLSILNNIGNRGQNLLAGKVGRLNSSLNYGLAPSEINELATATKRDLIRNGGVDFGDVNNMFNGDRTATEKVREFLNNLLSKDGENRSINWWFSQIMGTAALNGVDNYNKVKNTWVRFISGMEDILVSKGMNKQEAQQKLHEEVFGQKWKDARKKAESIMTNIQQSGGDISLTKEAIDRFTADVVKAELINNKIITEDELNGAWDAAYRSSGLEMGHVPNNPLSASLNRLKTGFQDDIVKSLNNKKYDRAGFDVLKDMFINKIFMRFAGGGTNWMVLKLEKGGLGIVTGFGSKIANLDSYRNKKSLSGMTSKEIEDNLYNVQKSNDRMIRGAVGLTVNVALLIAASAAFGGDEDEERRKKLFTWLENNKWANKYVNNWLPVYLSGWLAWQQQKDKGGLAGMANKYKYSPMRTYISNLINKNENFDSFQGALKSSNIFSNKEDKQEEGWGELGKLFGNWFNFDPLPYKIPKEAATIYTGMTTGLEKYETPKSFVDGYFKFGVVDWPEGKDKK